MFRSLSAVAIMGSLTATAWAGIAKEVTESGSLRLTGGIGQVDSYGQSNVLMDANNVLFGDHPITEAAGFVDLFWGLPVYKQGLAIGYLTPGNQGTIYTYDVLVAVPVLQLLGYDLTDSWMQAPLYPFMPDLAWPQYEGYGGSVGGGGGGGTAVTYPVYVPEDYDDRRVIPEPASGLILMLGAAGWMFHRRRQPA